MTAVAVGAARAGESVPDLVARVDALEAEVVELRARVDEMHAALSYEPAEEDALRRGHAAFEAEIRRQERGEVG